MKLAPPPLFPAAVAALVFSASACVRLPPMQPGVAQRIPLDATMVVLQVPDSIIDPYRAVARALVVEGYTIGSSDPVAGSLVTE